MGGNSILVITQLNLCVCQNQAIISKPANDAVKSSDKTQHLHETKVTNHEGSFLHAKTETINVQYHDYCAVFVFGLWSCTAQNIEHQLKQLSMQFSQIQASSSLIQRDAEQIDENQSKHNQQLINVTQEYIWSKHFLENLKHS